MAIAVGATLATVVLPALANGGGPIPPASGKGITPTDFSTGGKTTDCTLFKSTAPSSFQITSPTTKTYTAPTGATFALTVSADRKTFDFTSTGAAVNDVSAAPRGEDERDDDDPTGTAWYQYSRASTGLVTSDTALHTTKDKKGVLHTVYRVTFCYAASASISGKVRDQVSAGQPGFTVNLFKADGTTAVGAPQTTGADGSYAFANVPVGSKYVVCLGSRIGWNQTSPTSTAPPSGFSCSGGTAGYTTPTLLANISSGLNFGVVKLAQLSGKAFIDANSNGTLDTGEVGGGTVNLYDGGGTLLDQATPDGTTGIYVFPKLEPVGSTYSVCESKPSGSWKQLAPAASANCKSGDFSKGYPLSPLAGDTTNLDFRSVQVASISGMAFIDGNNDGANNDSAPHSPVTINLYQGATKIDSQTTGGDGKYGFTEPVGFGYTVCEVSPTGEAQTRPISTTATATPCTTPNAGEFGFGYGISSLAGDTSDLDFGSVQTIAASCTAPFGTDPNYQAQLDPNACATPKSLVFGYNDGSASDGHDKFAFLRPPFGTVTPQVPDVEQITWGLPADHHQIVVLYNDDPQGDRAGARVMTYCLTDPRNPPGSGFTLTAGVPPSNVLLPGESSCILSQTTSLVDNRFSVVVYSEVDGWRGVGP